MEKNETKEKKSNGVLVTVLIVFLLIVFTCFGYAAGGVRVTESVVKESSKEVKEKNESQSSSKVTVYETTDEKITSLLGTLFSMPGCGTGIETFINNSKVETKDVTNLQAYHMVQKNHWNDEAISLDDFQKEVHKYLGKDYVFEATSVDYKGETCPIFNYDAASQTFKKQETACGWTCGPVGTHYLVTKAIEEDGMLKLTLRVVFGDDNSSFYADFNHSKLLDSNVNEYTLVPYEKGSAYLVTYKLEDGNYVFVSSELA